MFSVEARTGVSRKMRSHSSIASHRSSSGVRFQRLHFRQTTHSLPFSASKASRRPTGKCWITSLEPRERVQNMQVRYTAAQPFAGEFERGVDRRAGEALRGLAAARHPPGRWTLRPARCIVSP